MNTLSYKTMGPHTVIIEWPKVISPEIHNELLAFRKLVKLFSNQIQETVISYNAIGLYLKESTSAQELIQQIKVTISLDKIEPYTSKVIWEIPVCYHATFSPDLNRVMSHTGLSAKEIIKRHTAANYRLYFCGFLPGFIYLGGLDKTIATPRLASPRVKVPRGAVGVAGIQTGIYPQESPGGWNLIGACPLTIFDPNNKEKPSPFNAGQKIRFYAVSLSDYEQIRKKVEQGTYSLKPKTNL